MCACRRASREVGCAACCARRNPPWPAGISIVAASVSAKTVGGCADEIGGQELRIRRGRSGRRGRSAASRRRVARACMASARVFWTCPGARALARRAVGAGRGDQVSSTRTPFRCLSLVRTHVAGGLLPIV